MKSIRPQQQLAEQLRDARQRTLALIQGLTAEQLMGPRLATVNPLRWEIGHVAYFHEYWLLRQRHGHAPLRTDVDQLFDSIHVHHLQRWDLPLPDLAAIQAYMQAVHETEIALLQAEPDQAEALYLYQYALFHEDMHTEAFSYSRQTLQYPKPSFGGEPALEIPANSPIQGDAEIPGGEFMLGMQDRAAFCFDNEKWAHPVPMEPYRIARTATSNAEFLAFVEAGGYAESRYWDQAGWDWKNQRNLMHPVYWRKQSEWQQRHFDQWQPLALDHAVIHISWYEAMAWCRFAGRRLPSEAEWELAAAGYEKRRYPWGAQAPTAAHANLDSGQMGCVAVTALAAGDSPFGCRQMLGNVWEWTATEFAPYPGFTPDMYADYSQPLFHKAKVLRGGAWPTRARMLRNSWRNYYGPDRNDVFAGFRSCAQ